MSAAVRESKRVWVAAALAAVAAAAAVLALFRAPPPPPPPPPRMKPTVELHAAGDSLFNDRALFKDPTPLFLPTRWNSTPPEREGREHEGTFDGYGPEYAFAENGLALNLPAAIAVPGRPADALAADAPGNPLLGMGRSDVRVAPLAPRWAFVEIIAADTGRRVFAQALTDVSEVGEEPALRDRTWQPVEFMAAVDAAGLVGQLMPVARSAAAADPFFQLEGESLGTLENYLAQKLRVGDRLPPGFYRVCIGP